MRASLLQAIQDLEPPTGTPSIAYTKQMYNLLHHRFVLKLTQEETADRLSVSRRTVNRLQHRAIHMLASLLWECQAKPSSASSEATPQQTTASPPEAQGQAEDWQSQMRQELASLQRQAPDAMSNIKEVIENALAFLSHLPSGVGVPVQIVSVQPELMAQVHPVAMHQVMIAVIQRLAHKISSGVLSIYARLEDGDARITLTGPVSETETVVAQAFMEDVPVPAQITLETCIDHGHAFVWIQAPSEEKISVLVVDDNQDMARFYRDTTIGTRYQITSVTTGQELLERIDNHPPYVIVLDVMLPDIDGWRLLMRLHEDAETRAIPVIVCSVVREKELAFSLGAAGYLTKPVRPREFIAALDQVCSAGHPQGRSQGHDQTQAAAPSS
ncbi:MAG: response regulator [Anaerolineae bacterium]